MKYSLLLIFAVLSLPAWACTGLQAEDAWLREAPPGASVMAGYVTLSNHNDRPLTLRRIGSKDFGSIDFHQTTIEHGESHMEMLDSLTIPARGAVSLAPGAMHLMLFGARRALKAGDSVTLNLYCAAKKPMKVRFEVRATP